MTGIWKLLYDVSVWLIPLSIAIIFHEVAHGRVARFFGDQTASEQGRLSFNPLRHVDPIGTVVLPLILAVTGAPVFGWAKPVPVNSNRMRNPRWNMVAVAAAGPISNILLALASGLILGVVSRQVAGGPPGAASAFLLANLVNFIAINLFLAVFNMMPVPPFDGSKVLAGILPPPLSAKFRSLDRFGFMLVFILLVLIPQFAPSLNVVSRIVVPPVGWMFSVIAKLAGI
jgi:Zn-dependent protease